MYYKIDRHDDNILVLCRDDGTEKKLKNCSNIRETLALAGIPERRSYLIMVEADTLHANKDRKPLPSVHILVEDPRQLVKEITDSIKRELDADFLTVCQL